VVPAGTTIAAGGGMAITESGALVLDGRLAAPGQAIALSAGGGISGGGILVADTLTLQAADGDIALAGANQVARLGASAAAGDFSFNDAIGFSVSGIVQAGGSLNLASGGALAIGGTLAATQVALSAASGITEPGGAIVADVFSAQSSAGSVVLDGANSVGQLGNSAAAGDFTFNTTADLAVPGIIQAGGVMTLSVTGALTLSGQLAATQVALSATTGISEIGAGNIVAGLLTAQATSGDITLEGPNRVDRLGPTTTPGNLSFNDDIALTVPAGALVQAGGVADIASAADITIDGTVSGATLSLQASGLLAVNGFSAIARSGPLFLSGDVVTVTGLIAAATEIIIDATTANLGGTATGQTLTVNAPTIAFNGLNAGGMQVNLFLGAAGFASGALDAGGLLIAGGRGVTLLGTIAGIGGEAAATKGVRADAGGAPFTGPPPTPDAFTLNGCPIGVAVCAPLLVAPITVANNPLVIIRQLDPRRFAIELTDTALLQPRPRNLNLLSQPARDSDEDLDLAPPNVRAEDY